MGKTRRHGAVEGPGVHDGSEPASAGEGRGPRIAVEGVSGSGGREYLELIEVERIVIGEQMLRHDSNDDDIVELAASIAAQGLLQPIGVTPITEDHYQLVWGSRRLAAHERLRRPVVLCRVLLGAVSRMRELALLENIQRRELTLGEECDAVALLYHAERLSPDSICDRVGKTRSWVNRRLAIPGLPVEVRDAVIEGRVSIAVGETIARLEESGQRSYVLQHAVAGRLSKAQVVGLCEQFLNTPSISEAVEAGVAVAQAVAQRTVLSVQCVACGEMGAIEDMAVVRVHARHLVEGHVDGAVKVSSDLGASVVSTEPGAQ